MHELEVGDELGLVDGEQMVHGFDFEDDEAFHHEVEAVAALEGEAFVAQRDGNLSLDAETAQAELTREAALVRRLQKPGSEVAVNLDASADDDVRKPLPPPFLRSSLFHFRVFGAPC
jgi:hypothetical protein